MSDGADCGCIDRLNEALAEQNAALEIPFILNLETMQPVLPHRVKVTCYKMDSKKRGKLPYLLASYCPFCGVQYQEPPESARVEGLGAEG